TGPGFWVNRARRGGVMRGRLSDTGCNWVSPGAGTAGAWKSGAGGPRRTAGGGGSAGGAGDRGKGWPQGAAGGAAQGGGRGSGRGGGGGATGAPPPRPLPRRN